MLKVIEQVQCWVERTWFKCIMLALAGFLPIYAFAPYNHTSCMVLSLLILLWAIRIIPDNWTKWQKFGYAFIFGYSFFNTQIYWIFYSMYAVIGIGLGLSIFAIICFSAFLGLYVTLAVLLYIRLRTKSEPFNLLLLFPSVWVFVEWVRGWLFGGYSWSDFGYTQVDTVAFRGFFAVLGEYGVSWLCVSLICGLFLILGCLATHKVSNKPKKYYRLYTIYVASILIIGHAIQDIHYTKPYGKPSSVALIQGNIGVGSKWTDSLSLKVYYYAIKDTKADIVMIPETGISQFAANLPVGYLDMLESAAKANHSSLVVGIPVMLDDQRNYINTAMVLTTKGRPYYSKYHLVPFGEYIPLRAILGPIYHFVSLPMVGFTAGARNQPPIVAGNQKIAFNICFENGFGSELISAAADSTIMANLSDMLWYGTTVAMDQHLQLSQARALENQRYYLQETNTSITAVIDAQGHIQSRLPVFKRDILRDTVQGMFGVTPYEIFGNWLIISFCSIIMIGSQLVRRFSSKP